jgi:hypothetical protein
MDEFEEEHERFRVALRKFSTATRILQHIAQETTVNNVVAHVSLYAAAMKLAEEANSLCPEHWQHGKHKTSEK